MPKFLEDKLRAEYGNNNHAIYGTMNAIGAMRGNKITAKGREMERKHEADMKKAGTKSNIRELRIEVHRGKDGVVTGHTVHHHMMPTKASKSGAFMEEMHHSFPFGPKDHKAMMAHVSDAISGGGSPAAKSEAEAEAEPEDDEEEG